MITELRQAFDTIGADLIVETAGNVFEIDVEGNCGPRSGFRLQYP